MAPQLEHWLLFQKNWVRFPAPAWWLTTTCHSSSTGPDALFWLVHAAQTLAVKTLIDIK